PGRRLDGEPRPPGAVLARHGAAHHRAPHEGGRGAALRAREPGGAAPGPHGRGALARRGHMRVRAARRTGDQAIGAAWHAHDARRALEDRRGAVVAHLHDRGCDGRTRGVSREAQAALEAALNPNKGGLMTTDLTMLVWTALLCLSLPVTYLVGRSQVPGGLAWGFGNRGTELSVADWAGRAERAHMNLLENLAPFAILVLTAQVTGRADARTARG